MGIPGLFFSLLYEIGAVFHIPKLTKYLRDTFYNKNGGDVRYELAKIIQYGKPVADTLKFLAKQSIPVIINEIIVRTFFFVRHLVIELKEVKDIKKVNWPNVIPFDNRTVERMITISSGTFMACDLADAAIRGAAKSGGTIPGFVAQLVLRVNFVGVGRFAIAIGNDIRMGVVKSKLEYEKMTLYSKDIFLNNAKLFYLQGDMWVVAENTETAIKEMYETAEEATIYAFESYQEINQDMKEVKDRISKLDDDSKKKLVRRFL